MRKEYQIHILLKVLCQQIAPVQREYDLYIKICKHSKKPSSNLNLECRIFYISPHTTWMIKGKGFFVLNCTMEMTMAYVGQGSIFRASP